MIEEFAPAKLNLYLHVTGRGADGYHLLDSLVAFADVGDTVTVAAAEKFSLSVTGVMAGALAGTDITRNTVAKVVHGLAAKLGRPPHVSVSLEKNLPVASGIGGGSADAAAALRGLARLWKLAEDDPLLFETGSTAGKDIPVCIASVTQYFGGGGEQLGPEVALPPCHIVLANPGVQVATADVFRARTGSFSPAARLENTPRDAADLAAMLAARRNDLTEAALHVAPAVGDVLAALTATRNCLLARMLGSGATCFGLYTDRMAADAAAAQLRRKQPLWWITPANMPARI
ncbi:MAG: 4-(cytidine 5'-diphospho)-2-C-methyl-D-erythritol kinase [Alphaproteobacteria bacterium]|nr:4-(cytidine 5'-diphospho)-2-C-methyl-D-erythritol kinase [Alphaproteobacteria bacterium]